MWPSSATVQHQIILSGGGRGAGVKQYHASQLIGPLCGFNLDYLLNPEGQKNEIVLQTPDE